ncbi:hypothetical protein M8312_12820 [Sphingomonas sp. KRR8]|uniref:hypothetical protein n=1 Tax=Sphingomonas sp. KRR8 TaxID=2942996 RepID=UPI0020222E97|nr:hypothetical protein [Sphingomonas sp. KRR8]URD60647.1 hypothetical protein M8312_12820 [Sphingomonas sp. KRR8]
MAEAPRDAVQAVLALIAARLADVGFALKPGLAIKRPAGDLTDVISCQTSVWNRRDVQAWFALSARLESGTMSRFRKARWPSRPANITRYDRFATSRQIKFPGTPHTVRWDALDVERRPAIAAEAEAIIRADVLPWFERMRDPLHVLHSLEDGFISSRALVYACAHGLQSEARAYLAQQAAKNRAIAEAIARMRADPTNRKAGNAWDEVALRAIELDLV